mmetsp:Transcript_30526/g.98358  ORF Transcript_30526/g.98358 Transcript_30526/m.98358 type:complete len:177 (+) Transcript_30526:146-676(+)
MPAPCSTSTSSCVVMAEATHKNFERRTSGSSEQRVLGIPRHSSLLLSTGCNRRTTARGERKARGCRTPSSSFRAQQQADISLLELFSCEQDINVMEQHLLLVFQLCLSSRLPPYRAPLPIDPATPGSLAGLVRRIPAVGARATCCGAWGRLPLAHSNAPMRHDRRRPDGEPSGRET